MRKTTKILAAALVVLGMSLWGCGKKSSPLDSGEAPEFSVTDLSNQQINSANLKGKVIFLNFWATWCHYCVEETPAINQLYKKYSDKGVVFLGISMDDDAQTVQSFVQQVGIVYPIAMSTPKIVEDFGNVRGLPTTFIIAPDGKISQRIDGYVPMAVLEQGIQTALGKQG